METKRSVVNVVATWLGESLREMAVLIAVFAPLDVLVQGQPIDVARVGPYDRDGRIVVRVRCGARGETVEQALIIPGIVGLLMFIAGMIAIEIGRWQRRRERNESK